MPSIWIIIENGEPNKQAYPSRETAIRAIEEIHKEILTEQRKIDFEQGWTTYEDPLNQKKENSEGTSELYIEKGIFITIQRFVFDIDIVCARAHV